VSYGGFACIQMAALQPPALRAIAPVYATDDRYTDDMHFHGGALNACSLPAYPTSMIGMNALPPRGERGPEFDRAWRERIEATPAWMVEWIRRQHDGPYWRNGSLRPDYDRITCPVLVCAGWRDGYRTAALRMCRNLRAPWQLLSGPWCHKLPDRGVPGPPYPFLAEMARFFHRHLGEGEPAPSRPRSVWFMGSPDSPLRPHEQVSGEWLGSEQWPQGVQETTLRLSAPAVAPAMVTTGIMTGQWCPPPPATGQFLDQRRDDALSATFDSDPLSEPLAVLGEPLVRFRVRHPGPRTLVSVKLQSVAPDGSSQHVTSAAVNLAVAGEADVELPLMAIGWRFTEGYRVRVAVAGSDWPNLWPLPSIAPLEILTDVELVLPGLPDDAQAVELPADPMVAIAQQGAESTSESSWAAVTDVLSGRSGVTVTTSSRDDVPAEGWSISEAQERSVMAADDDPLSATAWGRWHYVLRRPGLETDIWSESRIEATADQFLVELGLTVDVDGERFAERRWSERIPREGV
ncbi:MAG: CocE/NonD family hydrolase, partial [Gaiellales bacterium]